MSQERVADDDLFTRANTADNSNFRRRAIPSGWKVRPTDVINRDWLLVLRGVPDPTAPVRASTDTGSSQMGV